MVLGLILIPIYVQATAWSAGFGVYGWFRLSQVAAAVSPKIAIASVIWIHAMAATPACFLFCSIGLQRSFDSTVRQALLDFGPWFAIVRVLVRKVWPWIAASAFWTIAMTGNDMVVTNLFQVATITESVYQQVQFNALDAGSIGLACSFAILIALVALVLKWVSKVHLGMENAAAMDRDDYQAFGLHGVWRWSGFALGWTIVAMVVLVPIANLIVKAGWVATIDNEMIRRGWSPMVFATSIWQSRSFSSELAWSIQLSLYSSGLALVLGLMLIEVSRFRWTEWIVFGSLAFLLALPGPIVNLAVMSLLDRNEPRWMAYLADRTLFGPILALQARCLPIVFVVLYIAMERFKRKNHYLMQLDRGLPQWIRFWILFKAVRSPLVTALVLAFFVAFADLSSYLLVQPPQVTTVAMRMFDLLHYGIKNRESGLALTLVIFAMLPTIVFARRIGL